MRRNNTAGPKEIFSLWIVNYYYYCSYLCRFPSRRCPKCISTNSCHFYRWIIFLLSLQHSFLPTICMISLDRLFTIFFDSSISSEYRIFRAHILLYLRNFNSLFLILNIIISFCFRLLKKRKRSSCLVPSSFCRTVFLLPQVSSSVRILSRFPCRIWEAMLHKCWESISLLQRFSKNLKFSYLLNFGVSQ